MHGTYKNQNRIQSNAQHRTNGQKKPAQPWQRVNGSGGNAQAKYERYIDLAKEAARQGDRVEAQNCLQHAEHFYRVMNGQEQRRIGGSSQCIFD